MSDKMERVNRIDALMAKHQGDRARVAKEMGVTQSQLTGFLSSSKLLRAKWIVGQMISQTMNPIGRSPAIPAEARVVLEGEGEPVDLTEQDDIGDVDKKKVEKALRDEHRHLRAGLKGLALRPNEMEMASSLFHFHRRHYPNMVDVIGGCASVLAIKMTSMAKELIDEFQGGNAPEDGGAEMSAEARSYLVSDIVKLSAEIRKMSQAANQTIAAKALADLRDAERLRSTKVYQKPGFEPLLAPAEPPVQNHLHVHVQADK
jgi:hypothetical protein